jgi:hypothetical protein
MTRTFDFDPDVRLADALSTIRAALDDEGLVLSDANTAKDRPYAVRLTEDGRTVKRVFVPASRSLPARPSLRVVE